MFDLERQLDFLKYADAIGFRHAGLTVSLTETLIVKIRFRGYFKGVVVSYIQALDDRQIRVALIDEADLILRRMRRHLTEYSKKEGPP